MISVVDYGVANLGSVLNMLRKIGADSKIVSQPEEILSADKLILPGVGTFDAGMTHLNESGLIEALNYRVIDDKVPILGICLGMQLLTEGSEEGQCPGLGWIKGRAVHFDFDGGEQCKRLRVPHMGWNVADSACRHSLFEGLEKEARFYFAHSYYVVPDSSDNALAISQYGMDFVSAIVKNNIMGVQFHPEKSHKFGMRLLKNFAEQC